jgi:predicted TPR repeat methyltransferase
MRNTLRLQRLAVRKLHRLTPDVRALAEKSLGTLSYVLSPLYAKDYATELKNEIVGSCQTLLDVGCGTNSLVSRFSNQLSYTVGVDCFAPSLRASRTSGIHRDYVQMNALDVGAYFGNESFDCVLASDVIEHLSKRDGWKLLAAMERIARRKVMIFTPNGFLHQDEYGGNPYQAHLSGWSVAEMRARGYRVIGINGWKPLRGEYAAIRWRPRELWQIASNVSQHATRRLPELAFQILCVKSKG